MSCYKIFTKAYKATNSGGLMAIIPLFLSGITLITLIKLVFEKILADNTETYLIIGIFTALVASLNSTVWSLLNIIDNKKKIVVGNDIKSSQYDYRNIFSGMDSGDTVIITGQNLRSVIVGKPFLKEIKELSERGVFVKIVIAPFCMVKYLSERYRRDFIDTVIDLKKFADSNRGIIEQKNIEISFHVAAISLSSIIRISNNRDGIVVFLPKFAIDENTSSRIYCVLEEYLYPEYFTSLTGLYTSFAINGEESIDQVYLDLVKSGDIKEKS